MKIVLGIFAISLIVFLVGCSSLLSESEIYTIVESMPEIQEITAHQPIVSHSMELIDSKNVKEVCNKIKSDQVYKITFILDSEMPNALENMVTYIDPKTGKGCFNPEKKILPNRCNFGKILYCADSAATSTSIRIVLQSIKDINNVKFKSNYCSDEVIMDIPAYELTTIKFTNCNLYINYGTLFKDNIQVEYTDPETGFSYSTEGLLIVIISEQGPKNPITEVDTSSSCKEFIFGDGEEKNVLINGKEHIIKAHIESEDNWASFSVDGDHGPKGKYYTSDWGNMLMIQGNEYSVSNNIIINDVSITLLEVGYDNYNKEFAKICLK